MEHDNRQVMESIFAAFARGDIPFILERLTEDVQFVAHLDPMVPWSGSYSGKDQVMSYFQRLGGSVEVLAHPIDQLVAEGDTVVATGSVTFKTRAGGRTGESSWVYIWKYRDGKAYRFDQFNDTGLAQAFA